MPEIDELLLLSGQDIPYFSARTQIHQPRIKDIAIIGEKNFFTGIGLLNFDKDSIPEFQDKNVLEKVSNFDIIMMMIQNPNSDTQMMKSSMLMVLAILFPTHTIELNKNKIVLNSENQEQVIIDSTNFEELADIVEKITCLSLGQKNAKLNPKSKMAKKIADKLKRGRQKVTKSKGVDVGSLISQYVSILTVGEQKDMNSFMNYTLCQLFDEYKRYNAKLAFDSNIQARLAGATKLEDPKNWMEDLNEEQSLSQTFK